MSRQLLLGFAFAAMVSLFATNGYAQNSGCCSCGSSSVMAVAPIATTGVQSYQRFSYEPAASMQPQALSGTLQRQSGVVYPVPQVQSYRRFSYQPTSSMRSLRSDSRKSPWEYDKGDSRRYRP